MRPHGGHAVRRAGAAMVLAGPQQVPHSHTSDLWGLRLLSVALYRGGERDPKRRSACPQQGLAEWGQTQTQSGPAPTPPRRWTRRPPQRGVSTDPGNRFGRNKATSPEEKETRLKNTDRLLPESTSQTRTQKAHLFRVGAARPTHQTPEDSAELITFPGPGPGRAKHRGWLFPAVCGSGSSLSCPAWASA